MMNDAMTYETMDWEAEAVRVARAFGLLAECEFRLCPPCFPVSHYLYFDGSDEMPQHEDGLSVRVAYRADFQFFGLSKAVGSGDEDDKAPWPITQIAFTWLGTVVAMPMNLAYARSLVRALFHLDLLTPEIEAALNVSITAHEKLEWAREYEERFKLDTPL